MLKISLPTRETRVRSLIWEDSACLRQRSPCATTPEPAPQSPGIALTEPANPRARAPQQEKPWDQKLVLAAARKSPGSNEDPAQPEINKIVVRNIFFKKDQMSQLKGSQAGGIPSHFGESQLLFYSGL